MVNAVLLWLADRVVARMVWVFMGALSVTVVARAAEDNVRMATLDSLFPILYALLGGLVAGAIQWGAVRQQLRDLSRRVSENERVASDAHKRVSEHVDRWHHRDHHD